jgi:hypothetical protein
MGLAETGLAERRPEETSSGPRRLGNLREVRVAEPIRAGFWHVIREVRGGFFLRPGAITMALAALAIGLSTVEERVTPSPVWSAFLDKLFPLEPEAAHVVLGTIAGSMITVVAVDNSMLRVVLTFGSTQFSPRVLVAFVEDRVNRTRLALFVGTFTYTGCPGGMRTSRSSSRSEAHPPSRIVGRSRDERRRGVPPPDLSGLSGRVGERPRSPEDSSASRPPCSSGFAPG